jgi:hypothetical protein
MLKAGIAEPEKTPVSRQWLGKHVSAATVEELLEKKHATIEKPWRPDYQSMPRV